MVTDARPQPGKKIAIVASLALVFGISVAVAWSVARSTPRVDLAVSVGTPQDDVALAIAPREGELSVVIGPHAKNGLARFGDDGAALPARDLALSPVAAAFGPGEDPLLVATMDGRLVLSREGVHTPLRGSAPVRLVAGPATSALIASSLGQGAVLQRVDAAGAPSWSRELPQLPTSMFASAERSMVVVTAVPKDLGAQDGGPDARPTLLAIDAAGADAWARSLGAGSDRVEAVLAGGSTGDVVVVGRFEGSPTIDGTKVASSGPDSAWIGKLGADGRLRDVHGFGLSFTPALAVVAGEGDVYVAGARADGGTFVARVTAVGRVKWMQNIGGPKTAITALAVDARDRVLVGGSFEGTLRFARRRIESGGARDAYVARFGP